ncbi:MAG: DUF1559 family PulG-like putative transporter [Planctomycetota bacterium]|jgi:prepilin-type N-terminal cleavage/methylation domain-containing protein/prepilin-type processing-associated H-X9-DG protein
MNKKAFTLLELLVIMAILGILSALALPAFSRVREAGRRARCANNLRQHGIAWWLYLADHNRYFPHEGPAEHGGAGVNTFGGRKGDLYDVEEAAKYRVLNPYLGIDVSKSQPEVENDPGLEIFHCPNDQKPRPGGSYYSPAIGDWGNSYVMNLGILAYGSHEGRPLFTIIRPHSRIQLEHCHAENVPGHGGSGNTWPNTPVMVLFLDGHVDGPFLYTNEFEIGGGWAWPVAPGKKVLSKPNDTLDPTD